MDKKRGRESLTNIVEFLCEGAETDAVVLDIHAEDAGDEREGELGALSAGMIMEVRVTVRTYENNTQY